MRWLTRKKAIGALVILFAILLLVESIVLLFTGRLPLRLQGDEVFLGAIFGVAGVLLLAVGLILQIPDPVPPTPAFVPRPREEPPPVFQDVEIKRTEMHTIRPLAATAHVPTELDTRLETVLQRIASLKVRYGLGELSKEGYKANLSVLEKERAEIEFELETRRQAPTR